MVTAPSRSQYNEHSRVLLDVVALCQFPFVDDFAIVFETEAISKDICHPMSFIVKFRGFGVCPDCYFPLSSIQASQPDVEQIAS